MLANSQTTVKASRLKPFKPDARDIFETFYDANILKTYYQALLHKGFM